MTMVGTDWITTDVAVLVMTILGCRSSPYVITKPRSAAVVIQYDYKALLFDWIASSVFHGLAMTMSGVTRLAMTMGGGTLNRHADSQ